MKKVKKICFYCSEFLKNFAAAVLAVSFLGFDVFGSVVSIISFALGLGLALIAEG